jgi:hypothetical protein
MFALCKVMLILGVHRYSNMYTHPVEIIIYLSTKWALIFLEVGIIHKKSHPCA